MLRVAERRNCPLSLQKYRYNHRSNESGFLCLYNYRIFIVYKLLTNYIDRRKHMPTTSRFAERFNGESGDRRGKCFRASV